MARLPLSGDIGVFIVDADYNALQARSISDAEHYAREKAWAYLAACQTMPGWENAYLSVTGPILGTRESRHVNAAYQLTAEDITSGRRFDDVVALGAWAMEYHHTAGAQSTWTPVKDKDTYDIPLRTLICVDTPNLYAAGRAADGDQYAGGSLRVMGTALATGHAAGVAAAVHAAAGKPVPARQDSKNCKGRMPGWLGYSHANCCRQHRCDLEGVRSPPYLWPPRRLAERIHRRAAPRPRNCVGARPS